jgi:hypothetical protein
VAKGAAGPAAGSNSTGLITPWGCAGAGAVAGGAALTAAGVAAAETCRGAGDATLGEDVRRAEGLGAAGWATGVGRAVAALFE